MDDNKKAETVWKLAERLHWTMEKLDPDPYIVGWDALSERDRDFYRICVEALLSEAKLIRLALE